MKITTAYIISYLPDDEKLRSKRLEKHKIQLEYWKRQGLKIVVYAQNYKGEDYSEGVEYVINNGPLKRPALARNELLKKFYSTDQDFGLFLDDDCILFEGEKYLDSDNLIQILQNVSSDDMKGIDLFATLNPSQVPFTAFFEKNQETLKENLVFQRLIAHGGFLMFIRNMKDVWFDDWHDSDGKIVMGEDAAFGIKLTKMGRGCYRLMNGVTKDMGFTSSTWCEGEQHRRDSFTNLRKILEQEVPTKGKSFDWAKLGDQYNIPRQRVVSKKPKDYFF